MLRLKTWRHRPPPKCCGSSKAAAESSSRPRSWATGCTSGRAPARSTPWSAKSGKIAWSHDTTLDGEPANFHGEVLSLGDLLVVGSDNASEAYLYAFDAKTGEIRWKVAEPGGFPSSAVIIGSTIVATNMSGEVCALNSRTGERLWSYGGNAGDKMLKSALAVVGKRVAATLRGEVALLDVATGKAVWRHDLEGAPNTTLSVIGDSLYVGEREGQLYRLSLEDGRLLGSYPGVSPIYGTLVPVGECLLALWGGDTLVCVDHRLEEIRWSRTTDSTWSSHRPLMHGDLVVVGTEEGHVHGMDIDTGKLRWIVEVEGPIKGLSTDGDVLYVGTQPGRVYALRFPGGKVP